MVMKTVMTRAIVVTKATVYKCCASRGNKNLGVARELSGQVSRSQYPTLPGRSTLPTKGLGVNLSEPEGGLNIMLWKKKTHGNASGIELTLCGIPVV